MTNGASNRTGGNSRTEGSNPIEGSNPTAVPLSRLRRSSRPRRSSNNSTDPADRVDVVYFHRTRRCRTCLYAEEGTRYTVETYFADELASGKVTFQVINVEDQANTDIVEKYNDASYLTLCINAVRNGTEHIGVVTDIWLAIGNDEAFVETVKSRIEKSLNGET